MMIISYIAALWCAGYTVFVLMQMRYSGLGFWAALADIVICGVGASIAAWSLFKCVYKFFMIVGY